MHRISTYALRPIYDENCLANRCIWCDLRPACRTIADMLASHRAPKSRTSLDTTHSRTVSEDGETSSVVVLPSSTELFYFYGQTLEGCAMLSTGKPLYDLLEVFRKWLKIYAGMSMI